MFSLNSGNGEAWPEGGLLSGWAPLALLASGCMLTRPEPGLLLASMGLPAIPPGLWHGAAACVLLLVGVHDWNSHPDLEYRKTFRLAGSANIAAGLGFLGMAALETGGVLFGHTIIAPQVLAFSQAHLDPNFFAAYFLADIVSLPLLVWTIGEVSGLGLAESLAGVIPAAAGASLCYLAFLPGQADKALVGGLCFAFTEKWMQTTARRSELHLAGQRQTRFNVMIANLNVMGVIVLGLDAALLTGSMPVEFAGLSHAVFTMAHGFGWIQTVRTALRKKSILKKIADTATGTRRDQEQPRDQEEFESLQDDQPENTDNPQSAE